MRFWGRFGLRKMKKEKAKRRASWFVSLLLTTLHAIVAQSWNFSLELVLWLSSKTPTSGNNAIWRGVFWLRNVPILSDVVVTILSSTIVLTENGNFWVVPLLHSVSDIIRVTKWRRARWEGHVARLGESRNAYGAFGDCTRMEENAWRT